MRIARRAGLAASIVLICGVGLVLSSPEAKDDPESGAVRTAEENELRVEAIEEELADVTAKQGALSEQLRRRPEAAARPEPTISDQAESPTRTGSPESEEERRAAAIAKYEGVVRFLDDMVVQEADDPQWSAALRQHVTRSFEDEGVVGVVIDETDCHSSLCRVKLAMGEKGSEESLHDAVRKVDWHSETFFVQRNGEGEQFVVVYIARPGQVLPKASREVAWDTP